jgi:hypothetical protein
MFLGFECRDGEKMPSDEERWRRFDILLANFQAIGRSQSRFVNALALFLCTVWVVELLRSSGEIAISVLGATIQIRGLWHVVPLVCGILCLGLVGTINIIHHAWRRLDLYLLESFSKPEFFFTELDSNKNILDYFAFLTLSFRKPVLPDTTEEAPAIEQRWSPLVLLYPALVLVSVFTTFFSLRRIETSPGSISYVLISGGLQALFSLPFVWRKACLFTGVHQPAYDGLEWGDATLYRMPLEALRRLIEKSHPKK